VLGNDNCLPPAGFHLHVGDLDDFDYRAEPDVGVLNDSAVAGNIG